MLVETLVKFFESEGYTLYNLSMEHGYIYEPNHFFFLEKGRFKVDFNSDDGKVIGRIRICLNDIEIASIKVDEMASILRDIKLNILI